MRKLAVLMALIIALMVQPTFAATQRTMLCQIDTLQVYYYYDSNTLAIIQFETISPTVTARYALHVINTANGKESSLKGSIDAGDNFYDVSNLGYTLINSVITCGTL